MTPTNEDDEITEIGSAPRRAPEAPAGLEDTRVLGRPFSRKRRDRFEDPNLRSGAEHSGAPSSLSGSFPPRSATPHETLISALERELKEAVLADGPFELARAQLKERWLPLLQTALEVAGGDGVDARLSALLTPPGMSAKDPLLGDISVPMERLSRARDVRMLVQEGLRVGAAVTVALCAPTPRPLSRMYLEELGGKVELTTLLNLCFASLAELSVRLLQITQTLEALRAQLQAGAEAPLAQYASLKAERGLIEAEVRRRTSSRP